MREMTILMMGATQKRGREDLLTTNYYYAGGKKPRYI
jgi:hypothetical protein